MQKLQNTIEQAWENRNALSPANAPADVRAAVNDTIAMLDAGTLRVAEKRNGQWQTNEWAKKAVLLSFRLQDNAVMQDGVSKYFDKVAPKFAGYDEAAFKAGGFRVVPPAVARRGAFIAKNVILMPSLPAAACWKCC